MEFPAGEVPIGVHKSDGAIAKMLSGERRTGGPVNTPATLEFEETMKMMSNNFMDRMSFNEEVADLLKQQSQYMAQKELRSESLFQDVGRKLVYLGIMDDMKYGVSGLITNMAYAISGLRTGFVDAGRVNANVNANGRVHVSSGGQKRRCNTSLCS